MCLTEYDEAETMELFKQEGREEGLKEGLKEGLEERLIRQICRKLRKGKSVSQISDEVEEEEESIRAICDAIAPFGPGFDEEEVIARIRGQA